MQNATNQFPPLEQVTRPTVPTDAAAYYLNRRPQTLRAWACLENGAIRPVRINGRLAWPVSLIRALCEGGGK
ncbi:MAG: DNA-binding protein [Gammaproteobacteria bacterium]